MGGPTSNTPPGRVYPSGYIRRSGLFVAQLRTETFSAHGLAVVGLVPIVELDTSPRRQGLAVEQCAVVDEQIGAAASGLINPKRRS